MLFFFTERLFEYVGNTFIIILIDYFGNFNLFDI